MKGFYVIFGILIGIVIYAQQNTLKPHSSVNKKEMKSQYKKNKAQWEAMFKWVTTHDLQSMPAGKYPIEGTTMIASVDDTYNEPLEKRGTESHRKHIDFQFVVKGTERFALLDHASSKPIGIYNEQGDYINYTYDKSKAMFMDSEPNKYFLFFPSDWHIAKIATDKEDQHIRVVVIKLDYVK